MRFKIKIFEISDDLKSESLNIRWFKIKIKIVPIAAHILFFLSQKEKDNYRNFIQSRKVCNKNKKRTTNFNILQLFNKRRSSAEAALQNEQ